MGFFLLACWCAAYANVSVTLCIRIKQFYKDICTYIRILYKDKRIIKIEQKVGMRLPKRT